MNKIITFRNDLTNQYPKVQNATAEILHIKDFESLRITKRKVREICREYHLENLKDYYYNIYHDRISIGFAVELIQQFVYIDKNLEESQYLVAIALSYRKYQKTEDISWILTCLDNIGLYYRNLFKKISWNIEYPIISKILSNLKQSIENILYLSSEV